MKKVFAILVLSLLCVISFTCICSVNATNQLCPSSASKSITVYITPTGKCYHYKKSCAGKNANATTLDKCNGKRPCKKCVRNAVHLVISGE